MNGKIIAGCVVCVLTCGCLYAHRRVIRALLTGGTMPKAPEWHFWVNPEGRR